ncbi:hypothetical protein Tco_1427708, partial [Tanacetum coccineum]
MGYHYYHWLRSRTGQCMTQHELMAFCTTLLKKVESLETDLKQTKLIYGAAYTRLIKKVKKLEKIVKSSQAKRARIVVFDDEDDLEDPSKQWRKIAKIDQDPGISLVQHDVEIQRRYGHDMDFDFDFDAAKEVSTTKKDVSTDVPVSTVGATVTTASVAVSTVSPTRNTRVSTADDITMAKIMVYIRKSAVKDKAELEEEGRQTIARVHEPASSFNVEEWEDIEFRVEVDEELVQRLQAEEREKYTEIKTLFETTMSKVDTFVPIESEVDRAVPKLAARSAKRAAEEELDQESSKRQKTGESSELAEELRVKEADELSQEELQQMMIIVPEQGMNYNTL